MLTGVLLAAAIGYVHPELLVDSSWLAAHLTDRSVRIVDVRRSGFEDGHLPQSVWLDPESIRDPSNLPTYLMPAARFEQVMGRLGVSDRTRVILYDDRGGLLASRVWWMLNAYGHSNVALLNGGWVKWIAERRPTTTAASPVAVERFTAKLDLRWVATVDDVQSAIRKPGKRILDARTTAEMDGSDVRLSNRGGVIPSAAPAYWEDLLNPEEKTFKSADELRAVFDRAGVRPSDEVIAYCWVGHRSAVDLFALRLIGHDRLRNYLGSWEEWSRRTDLPTAPFKK